MERQSFTQKNIKVATIQDISCLGRCSLTVALPILSALGIETNVIPTAVLSSHTGEFSGYTFRDLTEDILPIANHWKSLGRHYDAIYTGYFGNIRQLEIVENVIELLSDKQTIKFVDPVMADNGELYKNFNMQFVEEMRNFCQKAYVILPNITEACYLTETPYKQGPYSEEYILSLMDNLSKLGTNFTVLTGVHLGNKYGACYRDNSTGETGYCLKDYVSGCYYGAGDTLASVLLGSYLKNNNIKSATKNAVDFTNKAIINTKINNQDTKYGLLFEELLGELIGQ